MNNITIFRSEALAGIKLLQILSFALVLGGTTWCVQLVNMPEAADAGYISKYAWAALLGGTVVTAWVLAQTHARRAVAKIALSDDGCYAFIENASLIDFGSTRWPVKGIQLARVDGGDAQGEEDFCPPQTVLRAQDIHRRKQYSLALRSHQQLQTLRTVLRQPTVAD